MKTHQIGRVHQKDNYIKYISISKTYSKIANGEYGLSNYQMIISVTSNIFWNKIIKTLGKNIFSMVVPLTAITW